MNPLFARAFLYLLLLGTVMHTHAQAFPVPDTAPDTWCAYGLHPESISGGGVGESLFQPNCGNTGGCLERSIRDLERLRAISMMNNQCVLILFLVDGDGRRVGYTELTISSESGKGAQGFTGLVREHRGKRLAKALKAAMSTHAMEHYAKLRYISTTTNPHNATMMASWCR